MDDALKNYYDLVAKVDELCRSIETECAGQVTCHAGCSECCRHISVVWVEAMALARALHRLPANEAEALRLKAQSASQDGPCPLLSDDFCSLYHDRPIICRTHGLPILMSDKGKRLVDFCPHNFEGIKNLSGSSIVDLDRLNTLLDSVNRVFITELFASAPEQERLSIAEALLLDFDISGDDT